ncbi:MAG: carboxypeptidase-like regulatory domain-containing protein [Thermoplasmatota archaeon]
MLRTALVLFLLVFAGCAQPEPAPPAATTSTLLITLLHEQTDEPLAGYAVTLFAAGYERSTQTAADGSAQFSGIPRGPCTLEIGFENSSPIAVEVGCDTNKDVSIRLNVAAPAQAPSKPPVVTEDPLPETEEAFYRWEVQFEINGEPAPAQFRFQGESLYSDAGLFSRKLPAGTHTLTISAPCSNDIAHQVTLTEDISETVSGTAATPNLAAPALSEGIAPGPSAVAFYWDAVPHATSYVVHKDGAPLLNIGNMTSWMHQGDAGGSYQLQALGPCNSKGPLSAALDLSASLGPLVAAPLSASNAGAESEAYAYAVLDEAGNQIGSRAWRTMTGVGNCCESFGYTDRDGRLYEYGGSVLHVSEDNGLTWKDVSNIVPTLGAEGSLVGAPGGDILGFNWDPYTGDQLWAHKYVAADDAWYTQRIPVHNPFHDRPWVAVVEGPFFIEGVMIPYISYAMSNYVHGAQMLMSYDGLHYFVPSNKDTSLIGGGDLVIQGGADPNADWIQSMQETDVYPLGNSLGVRTRGLLVGCDFGITQPTGLFACANSNQYDGKVLRLDSRGSLHALSVGDNGFTLEIQGIAGTKTHQYTLPSGYTVEDFDFQAHGALDQAVVLFHVNKGTTDTDLVYRFRDLANGGTFDEILQIGMGDALFGSGLGADSRFDYVTVNLTPAGAIYATFGDQAHAPPTMALELV